MNIPITICVCLGERGEEQCPFEKGCWNSSGMVTGGGGTTSLVQTFANGDTVLKYAYTDPEEALVAELVRQKLYGYGDPEWKDLLTTYSGETITYDGIGNPLAYTKGRVLTWQNGRRLASITEGN